MSNNPFIEQTPAHTRYPDLSAGSPQPWQQQQQQQPQQPQPTGYGYQPQQQPYPYQQQPSFSGYGQPPQQQQQQQQLYPMPTGAPWSGNAGYQAPMMTGTPGGFRPTSSFGQQMSAQLNGTYGGGQPSYGGGGSGWQQQQQAQTPNWNAIAQFDPYSQLGALDPTPGSGVGLFGGTGAGAGPVTPTHARSFSGALSTAPVSGQAPQAGQHHPRELVRTHKVELERWDPYAWKQLMNGFDALRTAWEGRKNEAHQRIAAYGPQAAADWGAMQEVGRLQGVIKEAENNFDTVAAAAFQVLEVQSSYRQSSDMASKRRVRESLNSALNSLPDWPPQWW